MAKSVIVIPARYQSSRFPGKPLAMIGDKTLLQRVVEIADAAKQEHPDVEVVVATDDERIQSHAESLGAKVVMTAPECRTGSDRALAACLSLNITPEIVVNLQGDAPLTPPYFISAILSDLLSDSNYAVATPVAQLSWEALDELRQSKARQPFSGTCAIVGQDNEALWFSKQIIPAIRKEESLRKESTLSPIYRHIGLYAYRLKALQAFVNLPEGRYEALEGLEQLRFLENGMKIKAVPVDYGMLPSMSGVDTPEDAEKAAKLI